MHSTGPARFPALRLQSGPAFGPALVDFLVRSCSHQWLRFFTIHISRPRWLFHFECSAALSPSAELLPEFWEMSAKTQRTATTSGRGNKTDRLAVVMESLRQSQGGPSRAQGIYGGLAILVNQSVAFGTPRPHAQYVPGRGSADSSVINGLICPVGCAAMVPKSSPEPGRDF